MRTQGWAAGLDPHPLFSVKFYLLRNPDVLNSGQEPLSHYIEFGSDELRDPHPLFVSKHYSAAPAGRTSLLEYFLTGKDKKQSASILDPVEYAARAQLSDKSARTALMHYVIAGWAGAFGPVTTFRMPSTIHSR